MNNEISQELESKWKEEFDLWRDSTGNSHGLVHDSWIGYLAACKKRQDEVDIILNNYDLGRIIRESQGNLILKQHGQILEFKQELETTKKLLDEAVNIMQNKLIFEDQHPCVTGDCYHEKQSECDEVLDSLSVEMFLAKLSKEDK